MKQTAAIFVSLLFALSLSCSGCDSSDINGEGVNSGAGGGGGGDNADNVFTDNSGQQCTDPTPCGDCDQDCRPAGNPFAPGGGSGGDARFDGDPCIADTDCKGTCGGAGVCEGFGSGGFHGDACQTDTDCRGICDGTNTCEGFGGGTGFDGDRCTSDVDCRGECGGSGVCEGDGGMSGSDPGDGTDQSMCLDLRIDLQHAIPTITLVIDKSGSMQEDFGNGLSRWEAAYTALMDPTDGLITDIQNAFRIGMTLFSSYSDDQTCPELSDVRPELNNFDPIDRVFSRAQALGGTPTGDAIMGSLRQFDVHPEQGRKLILLATDGEPNTCANPYEAVGQPEATAAAMQAYQEGIELFVLSVGNQIGRAHLEDMANIGQGLPVGGAQQAPYFEATDPEQLKNEMRAIIDSARSCIFRVQGGVVDPGLLDRATVTLDGMVLQYGDPNGWNYHQDRQRCEGAKQCIELDGAACASIQDGEEHTISGDFLCTYYDPENPPIDPGTGGGGTIGGGNNGPGQCVDPGGDCTFDGDCCSGVCGGICITQ